jgi:hypothetical protein
MADLDQTILNGVLRRLHEQDDSSHAPQVAALFVPVSIKTATIANGASLSGVVDLRNARLAGIVMPASWTAANLTFQTSPDGVAYNDRYDRFGVEYVVTAAAARSIQVPLDDFLSVRYLKVRSGTAGAAVAQGGARDVTLVLVR